MNEIQITSLNIVMERIKKITKASNSVLDNVRFSLICANDGHGHRVDFCKLATFGDGDLFHDVNGIDFHASREHESVGQLGMFEPRCGFVR